MALLVSLLEVSFHSFDINQRILEGFFFADPSTLVRSYQQVPFHISPSLRSNFVWAHGLEAGYHGIKAPGK